MSLGIQGKDKTLMGLMGPVNESTRCFITLPLGRNNRARYSTGISIMRWGMLPH